MLFYPIHTRLFNVNMYLQLPWKHQRCLGDFCVCILAQYLCLRHADSSQVTYIQYTYIVDKYKIYLYELQKQAEQRAFGELFIPVSQRVQMNFIFTDNVRILCLSCNVKKVGKLVRFRQKGQKQASFLAFWILDSYHQAS